MAKVIYDRSGKPHTIGGSGPEKEKEEPRGHKSPDRGGRGAPPSRGGPSRGSSSPARGGGSPARGGGMQARGGAAPSRGGKPGYGHAKPNAGGGFVTKERPPKGSVRTAKFDRDEVKSPAPHSRFQRDEAPARESKYPSRRTVKNEAKKAKGSGFKEARGGGKGGFSKNKEPGGRKPKNDKHGKKKGAYQPPREGKARPKREPDPNWTAAKAIVDKNKRGSAFLVFDKRDIEDIFIPRYYLDQLFHGDRVQVYLGAEGEIEDLKVLEHRFKTIFGKVHFEGAEVESSRSKRSKPQTKTGFLVYERKKAKEEVYLPVIPPEVKQGDWVKAELNFGENNAISATIQEVIGQDLPAIYDIQMVAGEFNLKEHHSFEAVKQAESYTLAIPGKDEEGRTDLRNLPFITIDGERARDFDDAVYVEDKGEAGFCLWVAIADVSHYVKKGTPLDDEAYAPRDTAFISLSVPFTCCQERFPKNFAA